MMFRCCPALLVVVLTALLGPRTAAAQILVPTAPPPIQTGPLAIYPTVNIRDVGTDSNVLNESANPKEDFTFTVSPRLVGVLRMGLTRLAALHTSDFVYFQQYKDEQSVNSQHGVRFDLPATRFRPSVSAEYGKTRARPNLEIDARASRTEWNVTGSLDFDLTSVTALTISARHDDSRYDPGQRFRDVELAETLNRWGRSAAAGLKFGLTALSTLVTMVEFQQDRFPGSPLRDADSLRIAPAIEFSPDAAITGRAAVGYRDFRPFHPSTTRYKGLVANVGVGLRLLGITSFDVRAGRDVTYSFEDTEPYYVLTGGRLAVTQRLVGPLDLLVTGERQQALYEPLSGTHTATRADVLWVLSGGFQVRVGAGTLVGVIFERSTRESTQPGQHEYERRRLFGSVTFGP